MAKSRRQLFASAFCAREFKLVGGEPIRFLEAAASKDGDKPALSAAQMVAYTGGAMNVGWGRPVVVDLSGLNISGRARPILKDHNPGQVVGHTTGIKVLGASLVLDFVVSGTGDAAREVVATGANEFPWQASVGVWPDSVENVKEGVTAQANGRTFTGPVYIVRKGNLRESSVVALGADAETSTSIAARLNHGDIDMNFEQWLAAGGFVRASLTPKQLETLQASFDAEQAEAPAPAPAPGPGPGPVTAGSDPANGVVATIRAAAAAEESRIAAVRTAAGGNATLLAQAIKEGWTAEATELAALRAARQTAPAGIVRNAPDAHATGRIMAASLALSAGLSVAAVAADIEPAHRDATISAAQSGAWRNMSIQRVFHEVVRASGGWISPGRLGHDEIRAAFSADAILQAGGFSTMSLSSLMSNLAGKKMLSSFNAVESVVGEFCEEVDANDFKQFTRLRLVDGGTFQKVGPTGELKSGTLSEDSYTHQVETRGRLLVLTREMIINDDLGAFLQLPSMIGRNGALAREQLVFTVLLANAGTFFGSGNKNYISGAGTVLGIDGFGQLEQKMLDQTDSAGQPALITPKVLLVPTALKNAARLLMSEERLNETTTPDKGKPAANPHAGKCKSVSSPYINAQGLSGSTSTAFFLFSDPAGIPALTIAYLRGQRTPIIESGEVDFSQLGMAFRGYYDFGAKLQDPRGAAMSKGAA